MALKRKHATPLLILAAALASQGSALADWDGCKPQQRQRVQHLDQPSLNGIYFSSTSDQSGVCRALGFERAAEGGTQFSGTAVGSTIVADANGTISEGAVVNSSSGYWITSILCLNPLERPVEVPELVQAPNINGIYFSSTSNQDGVCRAIGYERSAVGSATLVGTAIGTALIAAQDGRISGGAQITSSSGYWINQIICVNRIPTGNSPVEKPVEDIESPQLDGIYFSSNSSQDGICRAMGYKRAAVGSAKFSGAEAGDVIIVNDEGTITGGDVVNSSHGYWVSEIVCMGRGHHAHVHGETNNSDQK